MFHIRYVRGAKERQDSVISVLIVYDWYSLCSNCMHGADPKEDAHITRLGYEPHDGKGCGVKWDAIAAGGRYSEDFLDAVQDFHPELPMVEWL